MSTTSARMREVREALETVDGARAKLAVAIHYGRTGLCLVVWGLVWLVGFGASFVWPDRLAIIWPVATGLGWIATMALVVRSGDAVGVEGRAIALRYAGSAAVLSSFAMVWAFLLVSDEPNRFSVYAGTVVGCGFLLAGLWHGRIIAALGATLTLAFLAGLSLAPVWFPLYAAAVGGGALVGSGLALLRRDPL